MKRQEPRVTGTMPLKTCRTYQWPKMEILLSKSPNFNQSILSYLNWLPCSKSFHHILVRITNWCIFLHFRYVCNCYCSTNPRFILAKYLTEYSENCKVTPIMESVTRIRSVTASGLTPGLRIQAETKLLKGGNICEPLCNLRLVMLHCANGFQILRLYYSINYILV